VLPSGAIGVPGYVLGPELYRGRARILFRGRRERDGATVIVKTFVDDLPSKRGLAALEREFAILADLPVPGVPRALDLVTAGGRLALVLADAGGERLKALIGPDGMALATALRLGARLAAVVGEVHRRGIIHRDINPNNVLVSPEAVTLVDFSLASRLPRQRQRLGSPNVLEGTLAYMSPEQTGRMNRDVDHRTDFYSLGVTLYEMLTGRLPFASDDPFELIHAHIARAPEPPAAVRAGLPAAVSDVVMKLLAKAAEERYQSAHGVQADLERCLRSLEATGKVADLVPGGDDVPDRFTIPQRLYGRAAEIDVLQAAFERVAGGGVELVLVSGYSGIGKTSLIHELHKTLPRRRGSFIAGKFDQLVRNVPYGAIRQAFQGLVHQLLTETDAAMAEWRRVLREALGAQGQIIADLIPDVELLVGPQPPVPALPPAESQNRFALVFQRFLGAVASAAHPLVVFLDDLQWADAATLGLLRTLLVSPDVRGVLFIGAYRDNEVGPSHPLLRAVGELERAGAAVRTIVLPPLALPDLRQLVADTLRGDGADADTLSDLVLERTDGNPFFVGQFLEALHAEGLLAFDERARRWRPDLERIRAAPITDNVVDLMAGRIRRLEADAQATLRLAACIGGRFDLDALATVCGTDPAAAARLLWPALEQGLLLPLGDGSGEDGHAGARYRFLHDRVQQAAYALIPEPARPELHLRVGRLLLAHLSSDELDGRLFDVVDQLNLGARLITDPAERRRLTELNVRAGRKAKGSAAFDTARAHFRAAATLLPDPWWEVDYRTGFPLFLALAESEYLVGQFEVADELLGMLLAHAATPLDEAEVHRLRLIRFENLERYADAIGASRDGLRLFDIAAPETPADKAAALETEIGRIRTLLDGRSVDGLIDLPRMDDPRSKLAMQLLMGAWSSAYIAADHDLMAWLAARAVRLSLEHGNTEESASAYVVHGITIGSRFGDFALGHAFGRLALALNQRLEDVSSRAKVYEQFSCFVQPWREPLRACIPNGRISFQAGLETGDFNYATYAVFHESWYGLLTCRELGAFQDDYRGAVTFLERIRMEGFAAAQRLILHWGLAFQGLTRGPTSLATEGFDDEAYRRKYPMPFFQVFYWVPRLHLLVVMEDYASARAAAVDARRVIGSLTGTIWPALLDYFEALAMLAPGRAAADLEDDEGAALAAIELRMAHRAENCPDTFRHQLALVRAERARAEGRHADAIELFEAAVRDARASDLVHDAALADERYARFWLDRGHERVAAAFMTAAHRTYAQWGAAAKARALASRYPTLIREPADGLAAAGTATLGTTETTAGVVDIHAVMKAAHAIAGEIALDRLLAQLLRMVLENAGAQRAVLVLDRAGEWLIEADGTVGAIQVLQSRPVPGEAVCEPVINYVRRTGESVVLADASADPTYAEDPYVARAGVRSVLCSPVHYQGRLTGAIYLENAAAAGAFTTERIQVVRMLAAHAAIAINNAELFAEVSRLRDRLQAENVYLQEEIKTQHGFEDIVGQSRALRKVLQRVEQVAPTDTTVLITGETGTGKELIARAIHQLSPRKDAPLITLNCGAIPSGVVESELFGHEKGAFTGAVARKIGRFELADRGTLFLDEIGDLPPDLQVKLLRVLQEGEFERVGGTRPIRVNVRVIAATHRALEAAVEAGTFRADLFYRLAVFPVPVPPLRDRPDDVAHLTRYFVRTFAAKLGKRVETIPKHTMDALQAYPWPGNVRELRNVIERSVILSPGTALELGDWITRTEAAPPEGEALRTLADVERAHIVSVLRRTGWRVSGPGGAARILGLKPTTLEARMKKLEIVRPTAWAPNIS